MARARVHNPYRRRRDKRGLYYEHRAVGEMKLECKLQAGEVVHHHGDKHDNHPDNIAVLSSQRAHMLYENYRAREATGVIHLLGIEEVLRLNGEWVKR